MTITIEPFTASVTSAQAARFAKAAALDPAAPRSGVPPTYPVVWFTDARVQAAFPFRDGIAPFLTALKHRVLIPLEPDRPYRVSVFLEEPAQDMVSFGATMTLTTERGDTVAIFAATFRLLDLASGVSA